ncbi:hypothetical protein [Haloferax sp. Q22]|uniref:hypothetical protein n=1 Tax=Haloferax sp. (strain Q22) TaxID=1526048 RepID=UPI000737C5A5|nr:hypothetical protein [Haloferax sp. Q22]
MSNYTFVEKSELQSFSNYISFLYALLGASAVSFAVGIFTGTEAAFFLAVLYLIGLVGVWYLFRDDFSNIRQAIEDVRGENQQLV